MALLSTRLTSMRWLSAELVVIVLGISIAFQVEEWRSERAERRQERELLQSILTDFDIASEAFNRYLNRVDDHMNATRALRNHLRRGDERSAEQLTQYVNGLRGGYIWQATDATWQSSTPSLISDEALRRQLISFHDGFMPFMLTQSIVYQQRQTEFWNAIGDDFEREWNEPEGDRQDGPYSVVVSSPLQDIPSNPNFYQRQSDYWLSLWVLKERIPQAIDRIAEIESLIQQHLETL